MRPETLKILIGLHAQTQATLLLLESLIEAEGGTIEAEPCPHENADDIGVMGQRPGERMICKDCGEEFTRIEEG
jgi:hypothetical protein